MIIKDLVFLKEKSKPVSYLKEGLEIARKLKKELIIHNKNYTQQGIGLSAIQIGIPKQVCFVNVKKELILINPEIIDISTFKTINEEGCLSLPGVIRNIQRSIWIKVKCLNWNEIKVFGYYGTKYNDQDLLECICVQHELDHLLGKIILDY